MQALTNCLLELGIVRALVHFDILDVICVWCLTSDLGDEPPGVKLLYVEI